MLVRPGPPPRRKIGTPGFAERARIRVTGSAISRECGLCRFSRYDERAAVGTVAAVLGRIVAGVQLQLTGVRPGRHGNRVAAGAEMEVGEAERREADERESEDS